MVNTAIYILLIVAASILSLIAWKRGHKRYLILSILLFLTALLELYVQYLLSKKVDFTYLYHSFAAIEYPLFCWFLLGAVVLRKVRLAMKISIPVFMLASLGISFFHYHFEDFPGLNLELEGLLQSILCTYILFNLEVKEDQPILKNSYFWICSGILIFYGTTFFFNGIYTKILNIDSEKAMALFVMINSPLNLIMYAFISIGIICLLMNRKPSIQ